MSSILLVEKTGVIKEIILKSFNESELYKKAGFKTDAGFKCMHQWIVQTSSTDKTNDPEKANTTISLYGKLSGRAGQENKYDFPPAIDKVLFFGACLLIADVSTDKTKCGSLTSAKWNTIYEALFGGFEDIGDEDSEVSEDDIDVDTPLTKNGYVKDGFVVDDESYDSEEDESVDYETDEAEEDAEEDTESLPPPPKVSKVAKKNLKSQKTKATVFDKIDTMVLSPDTAFLDCTSELLEETYEE